MSRAPEGPQTEPVTVLPYQNSICDSISYQYETNPARSKSDEVAAILLDYCHQPRPNAQFYCTDCGSAPSIFDLIEGEEEEGVLSLTEDDRRDCFTKQAAERAAAARFISKVDSVTSEEALETSYFVPRPRFGSITSIRDSILDKNILVVPKTRSANMNDQSPTKRKGSRPPPLQLSQAHVSGEGVQTPLPTRTSSKGAPSFDLARPPDSARQAPWNAISPGLDSGPKTPLTVLTPENANTFQFDFALPTESVPSEPRLSRSGSGATTDSQSPPTPLDGPTEDDIRREIERFALEQGPYLRSSQRRARRAPLIDREDKTKFPESPPPPLPKDDEKETPTSTVFEQPTEQDDSSPKRDENSTPMLRRKKSIFGWLQKKPEVEVDELIDLYLTDAQKDEDRPLRRKSSKARLGVFRNRVTNDPLPNKGG